MPTIAVHPASEEDPRPYWTVVATEQDGEDVRLQATPFRGYRGATQGSLEISFLDEAQTREFYRHDPPLHVDSAWWGMMVRQRFGVDWDAFVGSGCTALSTTLAIVLGLMPADRGPFAGGIDRRRWIA